MKDRIPVLQLQKVRAFNHSKHHVIRGYKASSIEQAADSLLGLHSARLPSAYMILQARLNNVKPADLSAKLYSERKLIKLRCMRKTLHSVSFTLAPIVHKATLSLRTSDCKRYFINNRISERDVIRVENIITDILATTELNTDTILVHIQSKFGKKLSTEAIKVIVKQYWEKGKLCYVNKSNHWGKEKRFYALTENFYPELNLNKFTEAEAQTLLILEHVKRYGPVTVGDISWWSGLSKKIVRDCIGKMSPLLTTVRIEGYLEYCYMTNEMFSEYQLFKSHKDLHWLELFAYEDSTLKGYFETRFRYVDNANYKLLFNQIGEVRASIISDGVAIGIWNWDVKKQKIAYALFKNSKVKQYRLLVEEKIASMEKYLFKIGS